ncbi:glycosyltransferase family 4 protein [Caulobacter sp. DWP3-1-3b2]|uniref:glycosyltransferase family 4 protein n=1 Tax=Caulobacter sp. DWP3-1-3b2 TaxID=2804643 RepID=UPI003CF4669F
MVVTPLGKGGKGGIDRIMDGVGDELEARPRADIETRTIVTRGQGSLLAVPILTLAAIARIAQVKLSGRPSVAHINLSSHGSVVRKLLVARAAYALCVPYLIHLHGSRFRQYWDGLDSRRADRLQRMFERAAKVIVLGEVWRHYVLQKAPHARVVILPNATPAAPQTQIGENECTRILFLGRVGKRKGVPELLDALAILRPNPGWSAIIAGDGDVESSKARALTLDLQGRVHFTGWVGPDQVSRLLAESDVLVLPSHDENLPMSVIEAMAHGLGVVATPVGAVEDIIKDGVTGRLVPVGDAKRLAEVLAELIGAPETIKVLGAQARSFHAQHLEMKLYVERLSLIWKSAAGLKV